MRLIAVFPSAPLPFGSAASRWFYVLTRQLLLRGHNIACFVVTEQTAATIDETRAMFAEAITSGQMSLRAFSPVPRCHPFIRKLRNIFRPFGETYYADGLRRELSAEMERGYDILHLEELWTGWLGIGVRRSLLNVLCFDVIDWEQRKSLSWRERKSLIQMTRATRTILRGQKNISLLTSRLRDAALTVNTQAKYWVVPLAIDVKLYPVQPAVEEPVFGMIGSMNWFPSRSAAIRLVKRIWPLVKDQVPSAKLFIAGWKANTYLGEYRGLIDVEIAENLAHPVDFFSRVAVMVYAPSRGSGMKIKVLEAMAYGVPVVTTWEGVEGINVTNGHECFVEEDDVAIATRVATLLRDKEKRLKMRRAARLFLDEHLSPDRVVGEMVGVYEQIVDGDRRSANRDHIVAQRQG